MRIPTATTQSAGDALPTVSAARLAVTYLVVFVLATALLLGGVYVLARNALQAEADAVIAAELDGLSDQYRLEGLPGVIAELNLRTDSWGRTGAVYWLSDADLNRVAGNLTRWPLDTRPVTRHVDFDLLARRSDGTSIGHPVRAQVVTLDGGYVLLVGTDVSDLQRFLNRLRTALLWGITLTALAAAAIGLGYLRRVAQRLRAIASTCESIIAGNPSRRLPSSGSGDDFDQLALSVNHVLERLEHQSTTLRTTFDSAAHDLRTPLNRARIRLEQRLRQIDPQSDAAATIGATLEDLERVQRTLGTLLQIARADSMSPLLPGATDAELVDVGALLREIGDLYEPAAQSRGIALTVRGSPVAVRGNRQLLAQALTNLLENALKYVPSGGHVVLESSVNDTVNDAGGSEVTVAVRDDGPGIPAAERERVLQPFVRLTRDAEHAGSGLGLSLVAAIARLHGGRFELRDAAPGLLAIVHLPR